MQFVLKDSKCTVADRNNTESQNPNQIHKNPKQNRKIQNRITKPYRCPLLNKVSIYLSINLSILNRITKPKTESQNSKQNHKTQNRITNPKQNKKNSKQNRKTQNKIKKNQNRIAKPKTETQNSKQKRDKNSKRKHKTQNGNTKKITEKQASNTN